MMKDSLLLDRLSCKRLSGDLSNFWGWPRTACHGYTSICFLLDYCYIICIIFLVIFRVILRVKSGIRPFSIAAPTQQRPSGGHMMTTNAACSGMIAMAMKCVGCWQYGRVWRWIEWWSGNGTGAWTCRQWWRCMPGYYPAVAGGSTCDTSVLVGGVCRGGFPAEFSLGRHYSIVFISWSRQLITNESRPYIKYN